MMHVLDRGGVPLFDPDSWISLGALAGLTFLAGLLLTWILFRRRCPALFVWTGGLILLPPVVLWFYPILSGFSPILRIIGLLGLIIPGLDLYRNIVSNLGCKKAGTVPTGFWNRLDRFLQLTGWGILGFWVLALVIPAFFPPTGYDVLEYHLGFIPYVFRTGHVTPVPGIFYTAQPLATEMFYLAASVFQGSPWGYSPGLVQWGLILLATAFYVPLSRGLGIPAVWRPWLWMVFLSHPLIFRFQIERLTDWTGVVMLFAGLYVWKCRTSCRGGIPEASRLTRAVLIGLIAGASITVKWTNGGTVFLPLMIILFMMGYEAGTTRRLRDGLKYPAVGSAASFIAWMPWGIWLCYYRGNPFSPFMAGLFPSINWTADRLHFLIETHGPLQPWELPYWSNLFNRLVFHLPGFPIIAVSILSGVALAVLLILRRGRHPVRPAAYTGRRPRHDFLLIFMISIPAGLLLWGQLMHAADRFLAPLMAGSILLAGLVFRTFLVLCGRKRCRIFTCLTACAVVILFSCQSVQPLKTWPALSLAASGHLTWNEIWEATLGGIPGAMVREVNRLPDDSRVIALNEARCYFFRHPVSLASVFDESPIRRAVLESASALDIRDHLLDEGFTHILVNEFEQVRILQMHTPLHLLKDPGFRADREIMDLASRQKRLAVGYEGQTEFSVDPLEQGKLEIYRCFLGDTRRGAVWSSSIEGGPDRPAIWISPLN
jgi:hypothetical protein